MINLLTTDNIYAFTRSLVLDAQKAISSWPVIINRAVNLELPKPIATWISTLPVWEIVKFSLFYSTLVCIFCAAVIHPILIITAMMGVSYERFGNPVKFGAEFLIWSLMTTYLYGQGWSLLGCIGFTMVAGPLSFIVDVLATFGLALLGTATNLCMLNIPVGLVSSVEKLNESLHSDKITPQEKSGNKFPVKSVMHVTLTLGFLSSLVLSDRFFGVDMASSGWQKA